MAFNSLRLRAAFDAADGGTLERTVGVKGTALGWVNMFNSGKIKACLVLLRRSSADEVNSPRGSFLASSWAVRTLGVLRVSFNSHGGGPTLGPVALRLHGCNSVIRITEALPGASSG